jgi:hypothetical protein
MCRRRRLSVQLFSLSFNSDESLRIFSRLFFFWRRLRRFDLFQLRRKKEKISEMFRTHKD